MGNANRMRHGAGGHSGGCRQRRLCYRWTRHSVWALFLLAGILAVTVQLCPAGQSDGMPTVLHTGFLSKVFHDVDPRDAQAGMEVLTRSFSRSMGLRTTPQVKVYSSLEDMAEAIRHGELDLISMPSIDYLKLRDRLPITPVFVGNHNNGLGSKYVLIVNKQSGFRSLADLKGRTLLVLPTGNHGASALWLEVLLQRENKPPPDAYFAQMKEISKASKAVAALFFHQADAAVITRAALETSRLLNPQVETQIQVLNESPFLGDGIACILTGASETFRSALIRAVTHLTATTSGRQMFTIFQTTGVVPFRQDHLSGLEELLREQRQLTRKQARRN